MVDTRVNADGSGELRTAIVFSAEERQNFAQAPGNEGKGICDQFKTDLPPGTTFTEEEHDGEMHGVTTEPFANLDALRVQYAGMANVTVR